MEVEVRFRTKWLKAPGIGDFDHQNLNRKSRNGSGRGGCEPKKARSLLHVRAGRPRRQALPRSFALKLCGGHRVELPLSGSRKEISISVRAQEGVVPQLWKDTSTYSLTRTEIARPRKIRGGHGWVTRGGKDGSFFFSVLSGVRGSGFGFRV